MDHFIEIIVISLIAR